jgi:hypothetical protein
LQNDRRKDALLAAALQLERARALLADPGDISIDDIKGFIVESEAEDDRRRAEDAERERQRQAAELEAAQAREHTAIAMAAVRGFTSLKARGAHIDLRFVVRVANSAHFTTR